jgi:integrase
MPPVRSTAPRVRLHTTRNVAVADFYDATGHRRTVTLGPWGSPEAAQALARLTAELAAGRPTALAGCTVSELLLSFYTHAETYYRRPDGTPTSEVHGYRSVVRTVREMYGETIAAEFGIPQLKAVRQKWIDSGLARRTVNQMTWRVKRIWKWAAGEAVVPPGVYQALLVVGGLQAGRSAARETAPVGPVAEELVEATLPHVPRLVAGMIRLQRATGMRSGELLCARPCDIDMTGSAWKYTPTMNKMAHKGKRRVVVFGPAAQAVLAEFTSPEPTAFYFPSPKCIGRSYTVCGYALAIRRACRAHNIPEWHPHQLRHSHGTRVRDQFGLEAAQAALSHSRAQMTERYAQKSDRLAAEVAAQIG